MSLTEESLIEPLAKLSCAHQRKHQTRSSNQSTDAKDSQRACPWGLPSKILNDNMFPQTCCTVLSPCFILSSEGTGSRENTWQEAQCGGLIQISSGEQDSVQLRATLTPRGQAVQMPSSSVWLLPFHLSVPPQSDQAPSEQGVGRRKSTSQFFTSDHLYVNAS